MLCARDRDIGRQVARPIKVRGRDGVWGRFGGGRRLRITGGGRGACGAETPHGCGPVVLEVCILELRGTSVRSRVTGSERSEMDMGIVGLGMRADVPQRSQQETGSTTVTLNRGPRTHHRAPSAGRSAGTRRALCDINTNRGAGRRRLWSVPQAEFARRQLSLARIAELARRNPAARRPRPSRGYRAGARGVVLRDEGR